MHLFSRDPLTNINGSGLRWDAKSVSEKGRLKSPKSGGFLADLDQNLTPAMIKVNLAQIQDTRSRY